MSPVDLKIILSEEDNKEWIPLVFHIYIQWLERSGTCLVMDCYGK